ncbi:transporter substrate-binding domain-containing protein [Halobacteriovorax sp. GB3]|uniref:substrate-binding periplasmic protein n=1 Tax=Halobacteriovorax sp. GB3 TaxID=2719615 RepID=UPI00235E4A8E|nr:transporter substrate-binding domain-containing protein [Halobacteriovorax sp. GB3]MDD0853453.1 transporter substrate-binding domain-containing protein [Halobacteriovorax sp. GB3]
MKTILILFLLSPFFNLQRTLAQPEKTELNMLEEELIQRELPNQRVINVTGHPDYPPVIWYNKKSEKTQGVSVELLKLILDPIKVQVKMKHVSSWGRAQEEVKNGRVDLLLPPYISPERKKIYAFTKEPFLMDDSVIFVKKGSKFPFKSYTDLVERKGVMIINDSFGHEFDNFAKSKLNISYLTKTAQCFEFLLKDRAEYFVAGKNAGIVTANEIDVISKIDILENPVISTGMYIAVSKKSPWNIQELLSYIDLKIEQFKNDGTIKRIELKYSKSFTKEYSLSYFDVQ